MAFTLNITNWTDVMIGAGAVVGLIALQKLVGLFRYPSLKTINSANTKSVPAMGDNEKITIYGYEAEGENAWAKNGLPDASYYVGRVEAYLRAAKVPYVKLASQGGSENPRGKVPFANVKGTMTDESSKIIALVEQKCNVALDKGLSDPQMTTAHLIRSMLNGSLYWVTCHFTFHTEKGRQTFRSEIAHVLPPVILDIVNALVMRAMHDNLHGHGMGRMPEKDIVKQALEDLQALSVTLKKQDYFLGTRSPTSIDCDVFAMLTFFFGHPFFSEMDWIEKMRKEYPNLEAFQKRMKDLLYPELKEKSA